MARKVKRTTYAISVDASYRLEDLPTSAEAMRMAYRAVRHDGAERVRVLRIEYERGRERVESDLCIVLPPEVVVHA